MSSPYTHDTLHPHDDQGIAWGIVATAFSVAATLVLIMGYFAFFHTANVADGNREQVELAMRLQKVGSVNYVPAAAEDGDADLPVGQALYKKACAACHATGAAGAPKFGEKGDWAPRIATGMDALMQTAINGKGAMPARGGTTAKDEDLKAAIEYMVENSK